MDSQQQKQGVTIYLNSCRPDGLARLVKSLGNPKGLDKIVVGIEDNCCPGIPEIDHVLILNLPRTNPFDGVFCINWLAKQYPPASHIWGLNDDMYVIGEWVNECLRVPQGFIGNCGHNKEKTTWCKFPVGTRWHYDHFGWLMNPIFKNWGPDVWMAKTYAERTISLDIKIIHEHTAETCAYMEKLSPGHRELLKNVKKL